MNGDTPLAEVAGHLPREAAAFLLELPSGVQSAVLMHIRAVVVYWEEQPHIMLDPIAYATLLNGLAASLAPIYTELLQLRQNIGVLTGQLSKADVIITNLRMALVEAGSLGEEEGEDVGA